MSNNTKNICRYKVKPGHEAEMERLLALHWPALHKAGLATFVAHNSMIYLSSTSLLQMEGGGGSLIWTSPETGNFAHLAMWSDAATDHETRGTVVVERRNPQNFLGTHAPAGSTIRSPCVAVIFE